MIIKYFSIKFIIIFQFIINILILINHHSDKILNKNEYSDNEIFEEIDLNTFLKIRKKLRPYIEITEKDQRFLHGLIRKFKPKKLLELGVSSGGSSSLILNAIKDISNSKLYSIDRLNDWYQNPSKKTGWAAKKYFPDLIDKWTLYTGKNPSEYLEIIGNNIDFVFIDTVHLTPGEMFNWLEVLPFLKEESIIVFHDIFIMFVKQNINKIRFYSNGQLLCYIRGKLILPSYDNNIFDRNIGAIKLDKNQKKFYKQYFIALGNLWQYFPKEKDITILRKHFKKYFGEKLVKIYDAAVKKNKFRFISNSSNQVSYLNNN